MNLLGVMRSLGVSLFPFGPREIRPLLVTLVIVVSAVAVIRARRRATTALLFMLFDLEVVILIPWSFIYRDFLANHIPILGPILFFIGVLVLGLFYEVKKGALDWEK